MLEQGGSTESLVLVEWLTAAREHCGHVILRAYPRGAWSWREVAEIAPPRTAFARILVGCKQYGDNAWMLDDIRLHRLGPSALHAFFMQVRFLKRRLGALASIAHTGTTDDPSVVGRIAETREVLGRFAVASPAVKIFGRGLGAQFTPPDEPGVTINYIHNYYAFFLFKTGIVGTVLGLGALGVFVAFTAARARRAVAAGEAALLWAAVAAWIGYLAWSNVCPEILDFRVAPLWGLLLACQSLGIDAETQSPAAGQATAAGSIDEPIERARLASRDEGVWPRSLCIRPSSATIIEGAVRSCRRKHAGRG